MAEVGLTTGARGPLRSIWLFRWLLVQWVRRDFLVRYRQSLLGSAWSLVQPALLLVVYGLVFEKMLKIRPPHGSYVVFAFSGLAPWTFFSNALSWSLPSLTNATTVVKQAYFPRVLVPLSACGVVIVDLLLSTGLLLVLQGAMAGRLYGSTVALLPLYAALVLGTAAVSNVAAVLGAFVRDVRFALPLVLQLVFIATPIMYPSSRIGPHYQWVFEYNPLAQLVDAVRNAVTAGVWPTGGGVLIALAACVSAFVASVYYVGSVESRMPDLL